MECTPAFYRKIGSMVGRHAGGMRRAANTTLRFACVVLIALRACSLSEAI